MVQAEEEASDDVEAMKRKYEVAVCITSWSQLSLIFFLQQRRLQILQEEQKLKKEGMNFSSDEDEIADEMFLSAAQRRKEKVCPFRLLPACNRELWMYSRDSSHWASDIESM